MITYELLGRPGRDNALLVRVDSGQRISRLLFDCGQGCLDDLSVSEVRAVDHLFFSHLHMDHVAGFDAFFRCNFNRESKKNVIWGPPETAAVMHHRFRGFWWNLTAGQPGAWHVHEVDDGEVRAWRFDLADAFETRHRETCRPEPAGGTILEDDDFTVDALRLEHHGPSLAYRIRERPRVNVDSAKMEALGLRPGPWVRHLKEGKAAEVHESDAAKVDAAKVGDLAELRRELLVESPGDSIAYVTDFLLDDGAFERLVPWLDGCGTLVSEAQYRHADLELARRHCHATTRQVGELARRADVGRLVLIHLSERYEPPEWAEMLAECASVFPRVAFPEGWASQPTDSTTRKVG